MASLSTNRILNAVLRKICDDDFKASLPKDVPRKEWRAIRQWEQDPHNHNRLEILGDSVLRAGLCSKLFQDDKLDCGVISQLKDVLLSNLVLAMVAEKCDIKLISRTNFHSVLGLVKDLLKRDERGVKVKVAIPRSQFKPIADRYEAVIGALSTRIGMDGACRWVETAFEPLVIAGLEGYNSRTKTMAASTTSNTTWKGKKRMRQRDVDAHPPKKRTKQNAGLSNAGRRVNLKPCSRSKKRTVIPDDAEIIDLTADDILEILDEDNPRQSWGSDGDPIIIDLTGDDSDEEEGLGD
ncbi:hypothetical protein PENSPDRAFT_757959 [Peniophora sp. CONT]|nr:hypothetical protein PENSPDRAFT_757959 [Peniophora sp. CONT]